SGGGSYTGTKEDEYELKIWDAFSSADTLILENSAPRYDPRLCFSRDSQLLASTSGSEVNVWNVPTLHKIVKVSGDGSSITSLALRPDGKWIAAGSEENVAPDGECALRIWSTSNGAPPTTLPGYTSHISSISFSSDGNRIVSGSWDGSA